MGGDNNSSGISNNTIGNEGWSDVFQYNKLVSNSMNYTISSLNGGGICGNNDKGIEGSITTSDINNTLGNSNLLNAVSIFDSKMGDEKAEKWRIRIKTFSW